MGDTHSGTLADVQKDVQTNAYDFLLHCGDLAYDFWTADGQVISLSLGLSLTRGLVTLDQVLKPGLGCRWGWTS